MLEARFFWMQCFNMGHNGYGINMYGVIMILMKLTCRWTMSLGHMSLVHQYI